MGSLLNAYCTQCEFRHDGIRFGSSHREETPHVPAIDEDTGEFVVAELDEDKNFSYYHEFGMNKGKRSADWIESADIFLSPDHNKCPQCGEFAMRFEGVGEWD